MQKLVQVYRRQCKICIMDGFLKSIFLLAFNGFLRFGEVVVKSKCSESTVIKREVVSFVYLKQYTFVRCHFIAKFQNKKEKKSSFKFTSEHLQRVTCGLFWHCTIILKPLVISLEPSSNLWKITQFPRL